MPKSELTRRTPPRTKRVSCYEGWKKSPLHKNMVQVVAGYRKAGLPGVAEFVDAVRRSPGRDLTMGDYLELQEVAMTLCVNAVFVLAELGLPEWIERRESHLKKMDAEESPGVAAAAAAVRTVMKFGADWRAVKSVPPAKRTRKTK